MEVATVGILKEIRRVSDPDKAQIIWDGIKTVRAQKQIPALPRLSRYMNRNYKLDKDTTQRLLDLAVEDNLVKLHKKVGTKGNKAGVEEDAYRLPTFPQRICCHMRGMTGIASTATREGRLLCAEIVIESTISHVSSRR